MHARARAPPCRYTIWPSNNIWGACKTLQKFITGGEFSLAIWQVILDTLFNIFAEWKSEDFYETTTEIQELLYSPFEELPSCKFPRTFSFSLLVSEEAAFPLFHSHGEWERFPTWPRKLCESKPKATVDLISVAMEKFRYIFHPAWERGLTAWKFRSRAPWFGFPLFRRRADSALLHLSWSSRAISPYDGTVQFISPNTYTVLRVPVKHGCRHVVLARYAASFIARFTSSKALPPSRLLLSRVDTRKCIARISASIPRNNRRLSFLRSNVSDVAPLRRWLILPSRERKEAFPRRRAAIRGEV